MNEWIKIQQSCVPKVDLNFDLVYLLLISCTKITFLSSGTTFPLVQASSQNVSKWKKTTSCCNGCCEYSDDGDDDEKVNFMGK